MLLILTAKYRRIKFDGYILQCVIKVIILQRVLETSLSEKNSFHVQSFKILWIANAMVM
jgi:hypothetical protein